MSDQRTMRLEDERRLLLAVALAMHETQGLEAALERVLRLVCETAGFALGQAWLPTPDDVALECHASWHAAVPGLEPFRKASLGRAFAPGIGLPGSCWKRRGPVWLPDVARAEGSPRAAQAGEVGLKAGLALPLLSGEAVVAVLEFFLLEARAEDEREVSLLTGVAAQLGAMLERKKAEASLLVTNQTLRAMVEASPLAIAALDRDARVTMWSRAAERIFGWREAEILGRPFPLVPPEEEERFLGLVARVLDGETFTGVELRRRRRDGEALDVSVSAGPLKDASGRVSGSLWLMADMTAHRRLENQLRQSQKIEAVGRLAGGIAHDFNNLLTAILGYTMFLSERFPRDNPARVELVEIEKAARKAASLTRQLLTFSRRQAAAVRAVDVNALVSDMETLCRRLVPENIAIACALAPGLSAVRADPSQLEQVLLNLVVNARDAMPEGGSITIETTDAELDEEACRALGGLRPGRFVTLTVKDTGCGMDAEVLSHLFEPFFTTKEAGKGTGLGLSTVYGIVRKAEGGVEVSSRPGEGTSFRVYLPGAAGAADGAEAAPAPARPRGAGGVVLVVEDDASVRVFARKVLESRGFSVLEAADGAGAIAACLGDGKPPVDLLLADVVMPDMTGPELATRLARGRPSLKVLFMSGYAERAAPGLSAARSSSSFLQKPFTPSALEDKVREALS